MIQQNDILTVDELAHILKVAPKWVREHCRPGHPNPIPQMAFCRQIRFNWPDVAVWLEMDTIKRPGTIPK